MMRHAFHEDLDRISDQLVELTNLAGSAMSRASTALLDADLELADAVIAGDDRLDAIRADLDGLAVDLLARQQPVATDLRVVVTAMRMGSDLERMGDLARHVAKIAKRRHPASAVPTELRGTVTRMSQVAQQLVDKTGAVIASKDVEAAFELEREDDAMDALHRELYAAVLAPTAGYGTETAVDLALLGRYYERFADHAVSVARRVVYLVTGHFVSSEPAGHEVGQAEG